jgi:hypothetical protein
MIKSLIQYIRTRSWMSILAFVFALVSAVFAFTNVPLYAIYFAILSVFSILVSYRED